MRKEWSVGWSQCIFVRVQNTIERSPKNKHNKDNNNSNGDTKITNTSTYIIQSKIFLFYIYCRKARMDLNFSFLIGHQRFCWDTECRRVFCFQSSIFIGNLTQILHLTILKFCMNSQMSTCGELNKILPP